MLSARMRSDSSHFMTLRDPRKIILTPAQECTVLSVVGVEKTRL